MNLNFSIRGAACMLGGLTFFACTTNEVKNVEPELVAVEVPVVTPLQDSLNEEHLKELLPKLLGEWHDVQANGTTVFHEHWEPTSDAFFTGIGFVLSGTDTVFIEHLQIAYDEIGPYYAVRIQDQNDGELVRFGLIAAGKDSMVFENTEHDFPQRIKYILVGDSVWNVNVSGIEEGNARMENFRFTSRPLHAL